MRSVVLLAENQRRLHRTSPSKSRNDSSQIAMGKGDSAILFLSSNGVSAIREKENGDGAISFLSGDGVFATREELNGTSLN